MSYYTYFYPKKDLYNERGFSEKELSNEIKKKENCITEYRMQIKAEMISAYYDNDTKNAIDSLRFLWNYYIFNLEELNKLEWAYQIQSDLKEYNDGAVAINHANCNSRYSLEDDILSYKSSISNLFADLVVLSRIKFVPKHKDNDRNNYYIDDDSDDEMSYLRYKYQKEIDDILDSAYEIEFEISQKQFMLDSYEDHLTEEQLCEKEEKKNSSEKDLDNVDSSIQANSTNDEDSKEK